MLNTEFNEINNIFAFVMCIISSPELLVLALVNVSLVPVVFVELILVRLSCELVLHVIY